MFGLGKPLAMKDVSDGTSNTMLVGERTTVVPQNATNDGACVYGVAENNIYGSNYRGLYFVLGSTDLPLNSTSAQREAAGGMATMNPSAASIPAASISPLWTVPFTS